MGQETVRNQIDRFPNRASGIINAKGSEIMTQAFLHTNWVRSTSAALFLLAFSALLPAQTPTVSILVNFDGANGADPSATLVQGVNGNLYGTTDQGGSTSSGTLFDVTPQGSLTTLNSFCCRNNYLAGDAPGALVETATASCTEQPH